MLRRRRSKTNGHRPDSAGAPRNGRRPVELSLDELAVVIEACRRYRQSIPIYLASSQSELRLLQAVIRKLS